MALKILTTDPLLKNPILTYYKVRGSLSLLYNNNKCPILYYKIDDSDLGVSSNVVICESSDVIHVERNFYTESLTSDLLYDYLDDNLSDKCLGEEFKSIRDSISPVDNSDIVGLSYKKFVYSIKSLDKHKIDKLESLGTSPFSVKINNEIIILKLEDMFNDRVYIKCYKSTSENQANIVSFSCLLSITSLI